MLGMQSNGFQFLCDLDWFHKSSHICRYHVSIKHLIIMALNIVTCMCFEAISIHVASYVSIILMQKYLAIYVASYRICRTLRNFECIK